MNERRLIPYDPNRLSPEKADHKVDGLNGNFHEITSESGFVTISHEMVERGDKILFDKLVIHPGRGAFVMPVRLNPENKVEFLLSYEWKDVLGQEIYNIPQGGLREGEEAQDAAIREVTEETGYKPEFLVFMGIQNFDSAYMNRMQPFYLGIVPYEQQREELKLDETEQIKTLPWMRLEEIKKLGITDGKTTIGLALAENVIQTKYL